MNNKVNLKAVVSFFVITASLLIFSGRTYSESKAEAGEEQQADQDKDARDKIKEAADAVGDKIKDREVGDDFLAKYIMKFTAKQEHINELLKAEGSNYRIGNIEVEVGVPPKVNFIIEKAEDK